MGCSEAAIRKIESEERKPSQQMAGLLARELQIPEAKRADFIKFARQILPEAGWLTANHIEGDLASTSTSPVSSNNLPAFLTSLVDRTQDIATVLELITSKDTRWVTLIGPPGIGKTRLSIHCGEQALPYFHDGVWFIDLSAVHEADFVIPTISRALKQFELPQSPTLEQLAAGLKEKELLLVLDNFEQVEQAAPDVAALLKACRRVKTLVSSRVPLDISGEYKFYVPTLSIPPAGSTKSPESIMQYKAVQLFAARARQYLTGFRVTEDNSEEVVEVCKQMDGIPLALELAAASLRHLTLAELAKILHPDNEQNWLKQIGFPARDLPARQQTLENVIAWSYTLLPPEKQVFFRKLGIFTGDFEAEAAMSICGDGSMDADGAQAELEYLTYHSLLQQSQIDGVPSWHLLETIHEFALMQLTSVERSETQSKHANYYHSLLKTLSRDPSKVNLDLFFQINGRNLHQALHLAVSSNEVDLALSLGTHLCDIWEHVGYLREGMSLIQQVLSMPGKADNSLRIRFLNKVSTLAWQQHRFDFALKLADEAVAIAEADHLDDDYIMLLNLQGRIFIEQGKYREAREVLSECLDLSLPKPSVFNPGVPLVQLGETELALGNYDAAQSRLEAAEDYLQDKSDIFWIMGTTDLAEVALVTGNYGEAQRRLQLITDLAWGHARRLLCYLSTLAGYFILGREGDKKSLERAVEIYGAIEAFQEHSGEALVPYYVELNTWRINLARQKLQKVEWQKAWENGRGWPRNEIIRRAGEGGLFD